MSIQLTILPLSFDLIYLNFLAVFLDFCKFLSELFYFKAMAS